MKIKPVDSPKELLEVAVRMEAQGHGLPSITHFLVMDNGEIRGAISDEFQPVIFFWMDEHTWNPLAAYRAWKLVEQMYRTRMHRKMIVAIQPGSPFYFWTKRMGMPTTGVFELLSHQLNP